MKVPQLPLPSLLAIALCSAFSPQALAAAGTAQFTAGDVKVKQIDGAFAPLSKGKNIESGQAIVTGTDGRAQVRFTDGGLISLQPNTEFKIASYVDKLDAKDDRFLVDLLRGSMRAITGLIGKRNRDNYKVNTATATIGIRGSGFNVGYNPDGTLSVTTELDAIEVCTAGGCVGLTAGESVKVLSNSQAPMRTNVRTVVPTPPPAQEALIATQQAGLLAQIKSPVPLSIDVPAPILTLPDVNINNAATFGDSVSGTANVQLPVNLISSPTGGTGAIFNAAGRLVQIDVGLSNPSLPALKYTSADPASPFDRYESLGSPADANFVGWGFWGTAVQTDLALQTSIDYTNFSYVIGRPTPAGATLPSGLATYSAAGPGYATFREAASGNLTFGVLTSAVLTINFGTNAVGLNLTTNIGNINNLSGTLVPTIRTFASTGGGGFTGPAYDGFLIGPTGDRAGLRYSIPWTLSAPGITSGTIGLRQN